MTFFVENQCPPEKGETREEGQEAFVSYGRQDPQVSSSDVRWPVPHVSHYPA